MGDPADSISYPAVKADKCLKRIASSGSSARWMPQSAIEIGDSAQGGHVQVLPCYSCQVTCLHRA